MEQRGQGLNPRSSSLPSALRWLTCLGLVCLGHRHGDQQAQALPSAGHAGAAALSSGVALLGRRAARQTCFLGSLHAARPRLCLRGPQPPGSQHSAARRAGGARLASCSGRGPCFRHSSVTGRLAFGPDFRALSWDSFLRKLLGLEAAFRPFWEERSQIRRIRFHLLDSLGPLPLSGRAIRGCVQAG